MERARQAVKSCSHIFPSGATPLMILKSLSTCDTDLLFPTKFSAAMDLCRELRVQRDITHSSRTRAVPASTTQQHNRILPFRHDEGGVRKQTRSRSSKSRFTWPSQTVSRYSSKASSNPPKVRPRMKAHPPELCLVNSIPACFAALLPI